jgi:hypothetical protein
MKRTLIAAATALALAGAAPSAHAGLDDVLKKACDAGNPWRLTPPPQGFATSEAPIKLNGAAGRMVTICNCTADAPNKNTGVWVRTSMSEDTRKAVSAALKVPMKPKDIDPGPATWPYYLPGKSCVAAGSITVILGPVDNSIETWGTWQIDPK